MVSAANVGKAQFMDALKRIMRSMFPVLKAPPPAIRARVLQLHLDAGDMGGLTMTYSATVQPLDAQGRDDGPALPRVEISPLWGGPGRGIWMAPATGTIVRLGYYYHDPSQPYIAAVVGDGQQAPATGDGQLLIQSGPDTQIGISADGLTVTIASRGQTGKVILDTPAVHCTGDLTAAGAITGGTP